MEPHPTDSDARDELTDEQQEDVSGGYPPGPLLGK